MYSFGICGIYLSKHAGFFNLIFVADRNYATIHHEAHEEREVLFFVFLFCHSRESGNPFFFTAIP